MSRNMTLWRLSFAVILLGLVWPMVPESSAGPLDQLTELTGKASVVVTLKGRDNFTSEYRYDVSVRNHSSDLLIADSLVIVLDKITNLAGEDREGLTGESFLTRFDVLGQDGETDDGKPFFRIPVGPTPDLGSTHRQPPCHRPPQEQGLSLGLHAFLQSAGAKTSAA